MENKVSTEIKINITCGNPDVGYLHSRVVDAQPILIDGYDSIRLFIHKKVKGFNDCLWVGYVGGFAITELSTGLQISHGKTKSAAILGAKKLLQDKGLKLIKQQIGKQIKVLNRWHTFKPNKKKKIQWTK